MAFSTSQNVGFHKCDQYLASQIVSLQIVAFDSVPEFSRFYCILSRNPAATVLYHFQTRNRLKCQFFGFSTVFNNSKSKFSPLYTKGQGVN